MGQRRQRAFWALALGLPLISVLRPLALLLLVACRTTQEQPELVDEATEAYFEAYMRTAFFHVLGDGLEEQDDEVKARAERIRERDECPPLRITIDGEETDFPHAYASVDEDDALKISVLDGDVVSCNGIRLPTVGRNRGLYPFREATSSAEDRPSLESSIVEEIELDYAPRTMRFRSLSWRGGRVLFHEEPAEAQPVLLSDSISGDTVEVCLPPIRIENTLWKGKDDIRGNRTLMTIEGKVRAKVCGPRMRSDAWHAGNLECDPFHAEEAGLPVELDLFVDPEHEFGLVGFRRDAAVTCDSLADQGTPFLSMRILFETSDDPDVGIASARTTDGGAETSSGFFGNSISPLGPRADRRMCLHRPLYWYREGKVGFVRGTLEPRPCPPASPPERDGTHGHR